MADSNAEFLAKAVLRHAKSMEEAQVYFDRVKRAGYALKGRTWTLAETATALSKCRVHFGLGPRGGKSKATLSRVRAQKGRSAEDQKVVDEFENLRVQVSKEMVKKRKFDDKVAKEAAAMQKSPPSLFDVTKKAKAHVMELAQGLMIPESLQYEIVRKAQDPAKLGLVLGLVEKFVATRSSLKDPASWLRSGLYSLREPAPPTHVEERRPHARSRVAEAEIEVHCSLSNDGLN